MNLKLTDSKNGCLSPEALSLADRLTEFPASLGEPLSLVLPACEWKWLPVVDFLVSSMSSADSCSPSSVDRSSVLNSSCCKYVKWCLFSG